VRSYIKFLLILLVISIIIGILTQITAPHINNETTPQRIPAYAEVVESDFSAPIVSKVLDVRDASTLMQPRLEVVKTADRIVAISCPKKNRECIIKAIYSWVRANIEHKDALLARDFILSPEETILYREGDSTTQSVLLISLLRAEGFSTRLASTPYSQFVEVQMPNEDIRLDPGCGSCSMYRVRYDGPEENIVWVS
jgi:hypothetical protein